MDLVVTLLETLYRALDIYIWVLIARILLSWFPNIDWYSQPFRLLRDLTDPVMEPFRRIIPPIGMIDISPIVLFIVIQAIQWMLAVAINSLAAGGGF